MVFYVFPSTNIVLVFTSKLCGRRTTHTGYTGLFFFYVFFSTTFVHSFDCFVRSVVEKVCFLDLKFSVMDNGFEGENFDHKIAVPRRLSHI